MLVSGCTTFKADGLAYLSNADYTILGHFEKTESIHKFLGNSAGTNLFNLSSDVTKDKIADLIFMEVQKKGGNGAVNVNVEYKATFFNLLLNYITSGIYAPSTIIISGDIIKASNGAISSEDEIREQVAESVELAQISN